MKASLTRRRLLQGGVAVGVAAPLSWKAYSQLSKSSAKARIVIVGAGSAGISIAARLANTLAEPKITLIDPATNHFYQPGFTMIAAGEFTPSSVLRSTASLVPADVVWLRDRVEGFEPTGNRVHTASSGAVEYDFLVLAPGLQMHFDAIEGLRREDLGKGNVHCAYDYASSQKCWTAIQALASSGGRAIFSDTWTKVKCGGVPKKINMIAEDYCRRAGARNRVDFRLFTASNEMFSVPLFAKRLAEIYAERSIPVVFEHRIRAVDTERRLVTFTKHPVNSGNGVAASAASPVTESFDFLHVVPPMSAPDFVRESPLAINPATGKGNDWVPTDPATLVHARYKNVFVAGDVADMPTGKTSAAIRMQAPVLVANLLATMENRPLLARYDGYSACPFVTEYGKVLLAEFNYKHEPTPSFPLLDPGMEHWEGWALKRYAMMPAYFNLILRGHA